MVAPGQYVYFQAQLYNVLIQSKEYVDFGALLLQGLALHFFVIIYSVL